MMGGMTIDEFLKVELRVAKVLEAERVEGSEKLLKLTLDAGDKDEAGAPKRRQILSGIAKAYAPEALVGREVVIVANLEPRMMMGLESQGMLLAASDDETTAILSVEHEVKPGAGVR
jgi:methionine--tRNA ligase beta chain